MANLDYISHQIIATVNGTPIPGAKIFYYLTGTTTLQNTYSDAGLTTPNANPVICDANGVVPEVYLTATRYKRTVKDASDVSLPQYDVDPLDASQEFISLAALPSPTYPFLRVALTSDLHTYRRNAANSAWIDEGPTDSLLNAATVTDQLTGTSILVSSTPDSVAALWQRGADIASAATLSLPATGGGVYNITGVVGVTGISSAQGGRTVKLRFAGILTLTHNAVTLILPGAANITTVAGDMFEFVNEAASDASGSNWRCFNFEPSDGRIVVSATQALQEAATNAVFPVTPSIQQHHPSAAKCWGLVTVAAGVPTLQTNYNVTSITDTALGRILFTIATDFSSANWAFSVAIQSTSSGTPAAAGDPTIFHAETGGQAAGTIALRCIGIDGAAKDPERWGLIGFGDQ